MGGGAATACTARRKPGYCECCGVRYKDLKVVSIKMKWSAARIKLSVRALNYCEFESVLILGVNAQFLIQGLN